MKTVCIVTQTFPPRTGGMENVMLSLAEGLPDYTEDVRVVADKPFKTSGRYKHLAIRAPKLIRSQVKRLYLSLARTPDVYLCDSWKSAESVPANGVPVVILAHGQEYLDAEKFDRILSTLGRAAQIVASSNATIELIAKVSESLRSKCICIYPTYGLQTLPSCTLRKQEPNQVLRILSLSRIERRKGLFECADALEELANEGFNFTWTIAGSGPDLEALRRRCSHMSYVTFCGRVSDTQKAELYSSCQLFLMPSYQNGRSLEGFGITYVEAAQYGCPAIGGIDGGAAEAVLDCETGWSVDGKSAGAIKAALYQALNQPELLTRLGFQAKQRFEQALSGNLAIRQIVGVLERACLP